MQEAFEPLGRSSSAAPQPTASSSTALSAGVGNVHGACGIHRHTIGIIEAGERRHLVRPRPGRRLGDARSVSRSRV
jgi:hypothetical protein